MTPKTLWVDVTNIFNRSGNFDGIARTEFQLAIHLKQLNPNTHYFVHNKNTGKTFEFTGELKNDSSEASDSETNSRHRNRPNNIQTTSVLMKSAKILGSHFITQYKKKMFSFESQRPLQKFALQTLGHLNWIRSGGLTSSLIPPEQMLSEDSVILSMGLNWWHSSYIEFLKKAKSAGSTNWTLVFDLIPYVHPHFFQDGFADRFDHYLKQMLSYQDHCFCISAHTQGDLQKYLSDHNLDQVSSSVFRLGDQLEASQKTDNPIEKQNMVLAIGTFEIRKNYLLLYQTWKLLVKSLPTSQIPKLVIVGKKGWLSEDIIHLIQNDPEVKDHIDWHESLTDRQMLDLLSQCQFTIYPSFYEGWGLPIAESLAHGVPVLASRVSSIPEISEDCIDFFSPYNSGELAEKIIEYVNQPETLLSFRNRVQNQYRTTDWAESSRQILSQTEH